MAENDWVAERFEERRGRLRAVAYRMLGSASEADDAVQEAWLRFSRSDASGVDNLDGWLTTVVSRVCLDMLRSRKARREEPAGLHEHEPTTRHESRNDPEQEALLADSVGLALLVVLDRLTPAERVAFVLHDMFDLSFEEIAPIVGRTPTAARQLASRGRRRVRGAGSVPDPDRARQRRVVEAFLAAARGADFARLLAVLDPDVVLRADSVAVEAAISSGAAPLASEIRGASAVGRTFSGRLRNARAWLVDGAVGLVLAPGGAPRVAFRFAITGGTITAIEVIAEPARLHDLDLSALAD